MVGPSVRRIKSPVACRLKNRGAGGFSPLLIAGGLLW